MFANSAILLCLELYGFTIFVFLFRIMKAIATILTVSVIGINLFFVAVYIQKLPSEWWMYTIIAVLVILYMIFVIYLVSE